MKRTLLFVLMLLALGSPAATVTGPLVDAGVSAATTRVEFWPKSTPFLSGTNLVIGGMRAVQARNGTFSVNLSAGRYEVRFPPTTDVLNIFVPNDSETYQIATLATNVFRVITQEQWDLVSGGGIAASTATNISAYQAQLSTNGIPTLITNVHNALGGSGGLDGEALADALASGTNSVSSTNFTGTANNMAFLGSNYFSTVYAGNVVGNVVGDGSGLTNVVADVATVAQELAATNIFYVNKTNGNNSTGDGSFEAPWATIGHAGTNSSYGATIRVMPGVYFEGVNATYGQKTFWFDDGAIVVGDATSNNAALYVHMNSAVDDVKLKIRGRGTFLTASSSTIVIDNGTVDEFEAKAVISLDPATYPALNLQGDSNNDEPPTTFRARNTKFYGQVKIDTYAGDSGLICDLQDCSIITTNLEPFNLDDVIGLGLGDEIFFNLRNVVTACPQTNTLVADGFGTRFFGDTVVNRDLQSVTAGESVVASKHIFTDQLHVQSYSVTASGTAATITSSESNPLNFGTVDPVLVITNAGRYLFYVESQLQRSSDAAIDELGEGVGATVSLVYAGGGTIASAGVALAWADGAAESGFTFPSAFNLTLPFTPSIINVTNNTTVQLSGVLSEGLVTGSITITAAKITVVKL